MEGIVITDKNLIHNLRCNIVANAFPVGIRLDYRTGRPMGAMYTNKPCSERPFLFSRVATNDIGLWTLMHIVVRRFKPTRLQPSNVLHISSPISSLFIWAAHIGEDIVITFIRYSPINEETWTLVVDKALWEMTNTVI